MNILDLATKDVALKKVSGTNGGEWQGPCPSCGGEDRFHVWPAQNEGKGGYWCRGCGKTGDNIQYLRDFRGMSFKDACAELRIDLPDRQGLRAGWRPNPPAPKSPPPFVPSSPEAPADLWQEKAEKFISWAEARLWERPATLSWLAARGIGRDAAIDYRLGWNEGERGKDLYRPRKVWGLPEQQKENGRAKALWIPRGLVVPYIRDGVILRIRIRRPEGEPRYYVLPGSSMATMLLEPARRAFVVVESELDAIAVAAGNRLAGAVALGSVAAKPDADTFAVLKGALSILNALDYDTAGARAMDWWSEQFPRCDRWPVPRGKDPGEAVKMGIALEEWINAGLPPALTIAPPVSVRNTPEAKAKEPAVASTESTLDFDRDAPKIPVEIRELYALLRNNPGVKIINQPNRYTVLRNGRYVGGRINELVFQHPVSRDYLMNHPAEEIHAGNLIL